MFFLSVATIASENSRVKRIPTQISHNAIVIIIATFLLISWVSSGHFTFGQSFGQN